MSFLGKTSSALLSIFGVKGAVDTIKDGTTQSFKNLSKITKSTVSDNANIDYSKLEHERLTGKLRFRQRMLNENLDETRYARLNQKQYNYSIAVLLFGALLLAYSVFIMLSGQIFIAFLAIFMILTVYLDTLKKATEIREQSFITIKEFLSKPALWLPTTKRENDYFNIENQEQVEQLLKEIDELQIKDENQ